MITHTFQLARKALDFALSAWWKGRTTTIRTIALQVPADLQTMSPVDTGLYRASHTLTLGAPSDAPPYGEEGGKGKMAKEAAEALDKAHQTLSGITKIPKGGLKVFITNNLAYAEALEHGHSLQAPSGVYALANRLALHYIKQAESGTL
jgi:hypothetical protein